MADADSTEQPTLWSTPPEARCTRCGKVKPLSEFYRRKNRRKKRHESHCKACWQERSRDWHEANKEVAHDKFRLRKYRITGEEYRVMLAAQGGVCAVCRQHEKARSTGGGFKKLAVDHDHETGKIRGLLCGKCNAALGNAGDSEERLLQLLQYLRSQSS